MGEDPKGIAASSGENNWFDSWEAHHVTVSPQEDRGGTAEEVGEGEGGEEEGCLGAKEPAARIRQACRFDRVIIVSVRCLPVSRDG